jgi:hypothetical protein
MYTKAQLEEYLREIRHQVCAQCIERPFGGPPCAPLGKRCGVELQLPNYLAAVHAVSGPLIRPYLDGMYRYVCTRCAQLGGDICPCPLDYLFLSLVGAIERVDRRRYGLRGWVSQEAVGGCE